MAFLREKSACTVFSGFYHWDFFLQKDSERLKSSPSCSFLPILFCHISMLEHAKSEHSSRLICRLSTLQSRSVLFVFAISFSMIRVLSTPIAMQSSSGCRSCFLSTAGMKSKPTILPIYKATSPISRAVASMPRANVRIHPRMLLSSSSSSYSRRTFRDRSPTRRYVSNSNRPEQASPTKDEEIIEKSKLGKIGALIKEYGPLAVGTYLTVYVTTLGSIFALFEYGFSPLDMGADSGHMLDKVSGSTTSVLV